MSVEPPREHPSTYYLQDRNNLEEMTRLEIQDKLLRKHGTYVSSGLAILSEVDQSPQRLPADL